MRILLRVFLGVSLAANVAGGAKLLNRHAKRGLVSRETIGGSSSKSANAASDTSERSTEQPKRTPVIDGAVAKTPSLELKAKLLAEGYPKPVVSTIIATLMDEKYGPKPNAEQKKQAEAEMRTLTDLHQFMDEARARNDALRYGDLPSQTIEAIKNLEKEHGRERGRPPTDRKFATALQSILTPAQIEEYMRYNSLLAQQVQRTLDSIDVDEATYLQLLDAATAREGTITPDVNPAELMARDRALFAVESYRRILGDEQFLKLAARFDSGVASADAIYQTVGLSAALRAELFMELYALKDRYLGRAARGGNREEISQAARSAYEAIVRKADFTPQQTAVFDQGIGGFLKRGEFR
jgi:hypothetical protein